MTSKKVVVIGAGPGGYPTAILAAREGFETVLVEKNLLGGTCLQEGCIPSKILLDAAKRYEHFKAMEPALKDRRGVPVYDYGTLIQLSRERVAAITRGLEGTVKAAGVNILKGTAKFIGPKTLEVDVGSGTETLSADYIVIACGASAKVFPNIPYPHERVWTNREALTSSIRPEKILILGGGAIGCEFASFWGVLGIPTTILEAMPRLLPGEDPDVSRELTLGFKKRGISVVCERKAVTIEAAADAVRITLDDGTIHEGSHLLVAVGIVPEIAGLGLKNAGVAQDGRGFIQVTLPTYATTQEGVYAIGDAIAIPERAHPGLAHVASAEAESTVAAITEKTPEPINYDNIPVCTFTIPEVAHVGFTEEQAKNVACEFPGHEVRAERMRYTALGRALALGLPEGIVKLVEHRDTFRTKPLRRIAGACVVGEGASEIIHVVAEARNAQDSVDNMKRLVFQHPTWSELLGEALRVLDDEAVHARARNKK